MRKIKAKFEKGIYRFFVEIENKNIRKDSDHIVIFEKVSTKKEADSILKGMIIAIEYDGENKMKSAGWSIAENWNQL